ncbi:GntR family transcriptional regulator [Rhizobium sp. TRM96647]|uniref:GntR family transcriptional regulator n=1 Tax=unclassified Rhizobium TaxID=2613769 RepID=UPI0021E8B67D|nr:MULTISPECIES: GntR family transcriptional regulator [unclassified Rhizobium]MCV3736099.1 GntR family transcriptional regulator [Rhizobium sp. TRM96647]MCV3758239.1 GntR family transcriptional regulator [Rhizobium sp. TRM96650]
MGSSTSGIAPRLYQRARDALASEITGGVLSAGMRLTESGVAGRFGISRAPARHALAELERLGLVRKAGARGYEVVAGDRPSRAEPDADRVEPQPAADPRIHFLSSWELLYPQIEIEIVSRTSLASWRINEAMLAKHHGVSRTVARDVVARLQQRGIVRKDDRGRWYAPALTARHIDELYELRWVLEPLALEKAFPLLPEGLLLRLRHNVEAAIASASPTEAEMLDTLEQELHVELLGHCGNDSLMRAISLPQALLVAHHFLYRWTSELFDTEPFLPEHLDVIDRLLAGDIGGAKEALVCHLQISRERAMRRIQAVAQVISPEPLPYLERLD